MGKKIAILMGSKSDMPLLLSAFDTLKDFGVEFEARILSAHRTPEEAASFAKGAEKKGIKVFICAAGMAAHLAGVIASFTTIPVIGIPIASEPFNGIDSLLSMVQMPPGIPVAVVSAGKAGAQNAALMAISILALSDQDLSIKLKNYREKQKNKVLSADKELSIELESK
ncbi:MAG TPA: 5-(carboxyamino)imidazole ribonucleotide mutase [Victivallales bacterium]|nr:5-(carboxyamino)imidazole ribonucleotide mutase [Victivallales bacterium]